MSCLQSMRLVRGGENDAETSVSGGRRRAGQNMRRGTLRGW